MMMWMYESNSFLLQLNSIHLLISEVMRGSPMFDGGKRNEEKGIYEFSTKEWE